MLVLSVAFPLFPVNADSSGGAEQILYLLERGLVQAGHRSLVIAAEGSQINGSLIPTEAAGPDITDVDRARAQHEHRDRIEQVIERERVDLVHFHGLDFNNYLPRQRTPMVATLHLPPSWYPSEVFGLENIELVCVSNTQASTITHNRAVTVIENGVEPIDEDPASVRGGSLLWLGRICPEKGTDIALRVAHRLNSCLTVAGPVHGFASHRDYFATQVEPLLDRRRSYIGPIGKQQKVSLLRQAKALLIPSLAPETSSLVAMEAISAGTPVIAFASGALPEVIEHGVTGYIVHSEDEMIEAVAHVDKLSKQPHRFPVDRMVARYLALYERVISNRRF